MIKLLASLRDLFRKHPFFSLLALVLFCWVMFLRLYNAVSLEPGGVRISSSQESFSDVATVRTGNQIRDMAHFATLSTEIYGESDSSGKSVLDWKNKNCLQQKILSQWTWVPLPEKLLTAETGAGADNQIKNPTFGLWRRNVLLPDGKTKAPKQLALVFKGTSKSGDIWSNVRWIPGWLGLGADEYQMTRAFVPAIEDYIAATFGTDTEIIAAGHSLGGGLAQQAAYASKNINRVYSFNGTAATGYYSTDADQRNMRKNFIRIFRVHEKGEFFSLLRAFQGLITPSWDTRPKIVDITFNFGIGSLIKQRDIESLACVLNRNYR